MDSLAQTERCNLVTLTLQRGGEEGGEKAKHQFVSIKSLLEVCVRERYDPQVRVEYSNECCLSFLFGSLIHVWMTLKESNG